MATPNYCHKPLANPYEQIRLLTILPARDNSTPIMTQLSSHTIPPSKASRIDRIRGNLRVPTYFAISYVCGTGRETEKTHQIFIDGKVFPVAANVHAAFHVYRDFTTWPFRMWIDCVCISQTDDKERSAQITLMRDIYILALGVYVWLGPATPESTRAMRIINDLTQHPLMNKAVSSILELHDLEAMEKAQGTQPSAMEKLRRKGLGEGYTALSNVTIPAAGALQRITDPMVDASRVDRQSSLRLLVKYPEDYRPEAHNGLRGAYNKGLQESARKRAIMNGRESTYDDESAGFRKNFGQAYQDGQRRGRQAEANLKARTDIDFNAMGFAERWKAKRLEANRIKAEQAEMYKARELTLTQGHDGDDSLVVLGPALSDHEKIWKPSSKALTLVVSENFLEIAHLIEKCLVQETQYFSRMWTLEEACVCPPVIATRGTSSVLFKNLIKVIWYLNETLGLKAADISRVHKTQWINTEWRRGHRLPLGILLLESRDRQCHDPRDRLFALSGLMTETPNLLLQPNYEKPVAEVYANATRFLIASARSLDVICGHDVQCRKRFPDLPSWTPDFRHFGHSDHIVPLVDVSRRTNIFHTSEELALQDPETPGALPHPWNVLNTTGLGLGVIRHILDAESRDASSNCDWRLKEIEERWNSIARAARPLDPASLSALNLASQLIGVYDKVNAIETAALDSAPGSPQLCQRLATLSAEFHNLDTKSHTAVVEYLLVLLCGRTTPRSCCSVDGLEMIMSQACLQDAGMVGQHARAMMYDALRAGKRGRRIAIVQGINQDEAESVLAAVPEGADVGDLVCSLSGCSVPACVRSLSSVWAGTENEHRYELVGECYVSGFMDREGWSETRKASFQVRDFPLV